MSQLQRNIQGKTNHNTSPGPDYPKPSIVNGIFQSLEDFPLTNLAMDSDTACPSPMLMFVQLPFLFEVSTLGPENQF
jgi:hypothetical protein